MDTPSDERFVQAPHAFALELDDGLVVYLAGTSSVLSLNLPAAAVWRRCELPATISDIHRSISGELAEAPRSLRADIERCIGELFHAGVVVTA